MRRALAATSALRRVRAHPRLRSTRGPIITLVCIAARGRGRSPLARRERDRPWSPRSRRAQGTAGARDGRAEDGGAEESAPPQGYGPHFIVAADGAWIRTSYERTYASFGDSVSEPGRPLGYLFLDKLFQLRAPVPTLSPVTRGAFFRALLRGDRTTEAAQRDAAAPAGQPSPSAGGPAARAAGERLRDEVERGSRALARSRSEREALSALAEVKPAARRALAPQAVAKFNEPAIEHAREHDLEKFSSLLDPNPRTIKRFLNAYNIARSIRSLEGSVVASDTLALWAILEMRWPALANALRARPPAVDSIGGAPPAGVDPALRTLFEAADVIEVSASRTATRSRPRSSVSAAARMTSPRRATPAARARVPRGS
ncbi:MAG: hypothetical protein FJZ92_07825 [Chloroflexi bacterium]|nr:hypothetical protein [Chloroflexota bacterium]